MYADIIVDITHEKLDKIFQYRIPSHLEGMLKIGDEVYIPFGRSNKEIRGYLISFSEKADYDPGKIKEIAGIVEDAAAIEAKLVALAAWMKETYGGTMIQALKTVLPIKKKVKIPVRRTVILELSEEEGRKKLEEYLHKNEKARARVLAGLLDCPAQDYGLLTKKLHVTARTLQALEDQGVLKIDSEQTFRTPFRVKQRTDRQVTLTREQQAAADLFWQDYQAGIRKTYLVYGVTGSGKTEVYMEMIRRVLETGRQVIVLIPEIALTYQTVLRFYGRFGDRVSILHSRMSDGERSDQIERVRTGQADVMIGPRSALFTPFPRLGLIVIDEEHEGTYKSEQTPRYHARETAIHRAKEEGASVVLGSATPSLESFYACRSGEIQMLKLGSRTGGGRLPRVWITDMREELRKGNRSILSDRLEALIRQRLERKEQIMLFLNRRGYAGFVSCRACGYVVKCPHCDVALSAHRNGRLVCHYCGYEQPELHSCPSCGSSYIGGFKAGTQQVEELIQKRFPEARLLRMDLDTTRKKDSYERILEAFSDGEADILIGTQMIVKGHDFHRVTLVGILAADLSLYCDDYRSGERTFQLLTQAAGRAGRGTGEGEVVIQTYSPDHYSIQRAADQDYEGFFEEEMRYRTLMGYPPAAHLLAILLSGEKEEEVNLAAGYLKGFIKRIDPEGRIQVIGPASPHVGKVADLYRRVLYLKEQDAGILIEAKNRMEQYIEANRGFTPLRIQFDLDPMGIF
ncbi:primosomal protein N' [uncultured Merdimonas sp.]|uniref:replication restart helicase PriA n=1 Tax=uncultured Merdimonas sp. TaxID=2023269 RepID=UPI00320B4D97